jgi:hypothetical protein
MLVLATAAACRDAGERPAAAARGTTTPADVAAVDLADEWVPMDPPVPDSPPPEEVPIGCPKTFAAGSAALTVVPPARTATGECVAKPAHTPRAFLDFCADEPWTQTGCDVPFGSQFCHQTVWTAICRSNDQCPASARCVSDEHVGDIDVARETYGWCMPACSSDADCGRCDLYCERDQGVCRHRVEDDEELTELGEQELERDAD